MKKVVLLLAVAFVFTLTAMAQEAGGAASGQESSQPSTTTTKKAHHSKGAMGNMGASGKAATLTGCISKDANSDGMYTLTNGRNKKGVEVGPADKIKDHAGHQVKLSGKWASAAAAGEGGAEAASTKEKGERHFEISDVQHISDTCSAAPGGGTTGMASAKSGKKGKKGSEATPQTPQ